MTNLLVLFSHLYSISNSHFCHDNKMVANNRKPIAKSDFIELCSTDTGLLGELLSSPQCSEEKNASCNCIFNLIDTNARINLFFFFFFFFFWKFDLWRNSKQMQREAKIQNQQ